LPKLTVHKLLPSGVEKIRYTGQEVVRTADKVVLEAHFTLPDATYHEIPFKKGDLFYEAYFRDKWYNINEIYDRDDGRLKCWYCNITRPPQISRWHIWYIDLALDLLVYPDRRQLVLDEDELDDLHLPQEELDRVWGALAELQQIYTLPADVHLRRDSVVRQKIA
jgi:uncharacterized protein